MKIFKTDLFMKYMKDNKLSVEQFCEKCDIPTQVLYMIFRDETDFDVVNLVKIIKILRVHLKDLFN